VLSPQPTTVPLARSANVWKSPAAGAGATYKISVPVLGNPGLKSGYTTDPYPCQLIVLSNGGARFVSLGQIPVPQIDDHGVVRNAQTLYIQDCHDVGIDPWSLMFAVFNPRWNVDPPQREGDPSREEVVGIALVKTWLEAREGQATPIMVGNTQIGTVSFGSLTAGLESSETASGVAQRASKLATSLLETAARLQPPSIREGKSET